LSLWQGQAQNSRIEFLPTRLFHLACTAVLAAAPITAGAEIVNVAWGADGRFRQRIAVPAGKFVKACVKLAEGNKIAWTFQSDRPLEFNVHHLDADVRFPANRTA
jgi:hypothetical protein